MTRNRSYRFTAVEAFAGDHKEVGDGVSACHVRFRSGGPKQIAAYRMCFLVALALARFERAKADFLNKAAFRFDIDPLTLTLRLEISQIVALVIEGRRHRQNGESSEFMQLPDLYGMETELNVRADYAAANEIVVAYRHKDDLRSLFNQAAEIFPIIGDALCSAQQSVPVAEPVFPMVANPLYSDWGQQVERQLTRGVSLV